MDTHWQDCCGKDSLQKFYWNLDGQGMLHCSPKSRIILLGKSGWCQNGRKNAEHGSNVEEIDGTCVKSTPPVTENHYKNGYENCTYSMNNIHMSNEDNNHDTNYINKHKDANHDTRKLHL